jgi:hypothetical protein
MTVAKFKMAGREYVIVPRREYERVAAKLAEDARDVKKAKAAASNFRRTGQGVTLESLKRELAS